MGCHLKVAAVVLFGLLGPVNAQQRRVEVRHLDVDLRRTAHLLNIPIAKVEEARRLLHWATDLAVERAKEEELRTLAMFWIVIDNRQAFPRMERFLEELRRQAARSPDPATYDQITRNARLLVMDLSRAEPEFGEKIMANWPEAPTAVASAEMALQRREIEEQVISSRFWVDLDGALEEMRAFEQGTANLELRALALANLGRSARFEEANALVDETIAQLTRMESTPDAARDLRQLIRMYASFGDPAKTRDLILLWANTAEAVASNTGGNNLEISGIEFTAFENQVLDLLRSLGQTPQTVVEALESFPELAQKLETVGGYDAFVTSRSRSYNGIRKKEEAESEGLQARISELLESLRSSYTKRPDETRERLEKAARLIGQLGDPALELEFFKNVVSAYFLYEGHLPEKVRLQGLEIIEAIREGPSAGEEESGPQRQAEAERLETMIHAFWLWSDAAAARAAVEALPEGVRFRVLHDYLAQIAKPRYRHWRF